jgi:MYXO-CTERM domain-containing protein
MAPADAASDAVAPLDAARDAMALADSGARDASRDAAFAEDGSAEEDAGSLTAPSNSGCSCDTAGGAANGTFGPLALFGLALVFARRRRR